MIRYALVCTDGHAFEAWFRDSAAFEAQSRDGRVECALCRSTQVRKALMAPALRRRRASETAEPVPSTTSETPTVAAVSPGPALVDDERFRALRAMVRELHGRLRETAENVGRAFPEEARKIHADDAPARPIYGVATPDEARALLEDGIDVMPLPSLPEDRN